MCLTYSCVHLQLRDKPVSIALVDSFTSFKVRVEAPDSMYTPKFVLNLGKLYLMVWRQQLNP